MIAWTDLKKDLNLDGEFRRACRHWNATVRLSVGDQHQLLVLENGELESIEGCDPDAACDVFIKAPTSDWQELLEPVPRPFYQDLWFAAAHHGFELNPEPLDFAAYYQALSRMVAVMREHRQKENRQKKSGAA